MPRSTGPPTTSSGVRDLPVMSTVAPGDIRAQLPAAPPEQAEPFADVLADLDRVLLPGFTHWNHPRFFAYFSITGSQPGILAELLTATLNLNGMLWRTSPAVTELEQLTLSWMCQLLGFPETWHGHIEDSASTSTLAALCAARTALPDRRVVVASEHAHSSIDRACRILGLELRHAPVDDAFRMRVDGLDLSDACAVVAAVGTTSTTSVDPVPEIADAAAASGAWLHIDAAYSGSARVCPELRTPGFERADSVVVNPHKWLFTPDRLLVPLHVAPGRPARGVRAHARVPAHLRRGRPEPQRVRAVAGAALPRAQAVGRAALLRPRRAPGD